MWRTIWCKIGRPLAVNLSPRKIIQSTLGDIFGVAYDSVQNWPTFSTHPNTVENNSEHFGGYFWNHQGAENIVPEPRAGSNSKARVHSNLKNPRLRPLNLLAPVTFIIFIILYISVISNIKIKPPEFVSE